MSDASDSASRNDPTERVDQFFGVLRNAFTSGATPESRSAAASACRALLGVLEPPAASGEVAAPPSSPATSMLGAVKALPREQIVALATGMLHKFFTSKTPVYRTAPPRSIESEP